MVFNGVCIVRQGLSAPAEAGSADRLYVKDVTHMLYFQYLTASVGLIQSAQQTCLTFRFIFHLNFPPQSSLNDTGIKQKIHMPKRMKKWKTI